MYYPRPDFFLLIFSSFILYVVVISILLWSDMADVFTFIFATIPISFVYTKSSVFSFLVVSSMIFIIQCSSHISLNLLNCTFLSIVAFDIDLIFHMYPPLSILFQLTKGKLNSPLIIIVCFDFSTLLRIFF